jgi:hopanoid biosynthesis associated protein HpnK
MQIILNADDFGRTPAINAAVVQAHQQGVLTATSLMAGAEAAEEAVALARTLPELAVGLHLVVVGGKAALSHRQAPHIVDEQGRFSNDPFGAGLRYAFSRTARQELACEMEAQFERFMATGLPLSHVDGHMHMHMHPTVLKLLVPLAVQYGAQGIRVPRDDLRLGLRYDRRHAGTKILWATAFGLLARAQMRFIRSHPLAVTDRVYGLMQTGQMSEEYVIWLLHRINVPTAEIYLHPSTVPLDEPLGPNPGDLAALISPAVRKAIAERGIRLVTYPALAHNQGVKR